MPPSTIRLIRRPLLQRGRYPYRELLSTLGTKRAIFYPGTGDGLLKAVASMRRHMYRRQYRLLATQQPGGMALWIEPRNGTAA